MSWLSKALPPKIKRNDSGVARRSSLPEGLWSKCVACEAVLYATDLFISPYMGKDLSLIHI